MRHHHSVSPHRPIVDRRRFLVAGSLLPLLSCGEAGQPKEVVEERVPIPVPEVLGIQSYTLRKVLPGDVQGTLRTVAEIGYKSVEGLRSNLPEIKPVCDDLHLSIPSVHFEYACLTGDWTHYGGKPPKPNYNLEAALADAQQAGVSWLTVPYIPQPERTGADLYRRLAEHLNAAGETASKFNVKVAYHHHAFEFERYRDKTGFEMLLEAMEPGKSFIELDIYWVSVAGEDPAAILRRYPQHIKLVHLKDKKQGTPVMQSEAVPRDSFLELGQGILDLPETLRACREIGVEHYFVEQDECPGNPLDSLRTSYAYIEDLRGEQA
jgi:sugar phosphate isomerase/epimerase